MVLHSGHPEHSRGDHPCLAWRRRNAPAQDATLLVNGRSAGTLHLREAGNECRRYAGLLTKWKARWYRRCIKYRLTPLGFAWIIRVKARTELVLSAGFSGRTRASTLLLTIQGQNPFRSAPCCTGKPKRCGLQRPAGLAKRASLQPYGQVALGNQTDSGFALCGFSCVNA